MSTQGFKLFKLPDLALEAVLRQSEPICVIHIGTASKKSRQHLLPFRYLFQNYEIRIYFTSDSYPEIVIWTKNNENLHSSFTVILKTKEDTPAPLPDSCEAIEFIIDLFLLNRIIESIAVVNWRRELIPIFDWAFSPVLSVATFELDMPHIKDDDLAHFLKTRKVTKTLSMDVYPSHEFKTFIPFNEEDVFLLNAHWLGPYNLLLLNCVQITMTHEKITNEQLIQFMRYWLDGLAMLKMRSFCLKGLDVRVPLILRHLPHEVLDLHALTILLKEHDINVREEAEGGAVIKRNDGVQAVILLFPVGITPQFHVYILR